VKALDRKLMRDLIGARATLLSVLLVVVIGVACFVGLATSYVSLEHARREYYAQCRMADFSIELKKLPLGELQAVLDEPGVIEVRPRITFDTTLDVPNVPKPVRGRLVSLPDDPGVMINGVMLRRGGWFTPHRPNEVIVSEAFARARSIHPGQTIHAIMNNRRQDLFVIGTAISSEFVYLISPGGIAPDPDNYGVIYIKHSFAEEAFDFDGACNQVVGLLTPEARERPGLVLDRIERRLEDYGVFSTTPRSRQVSHSFLRDEINGLRVSSMLTPMIFLTVAALILNILMTRLAEQQRVALGTLKALGYTDRALTWHYLKFGVIVGVIGGVLGMAGGMGVTKGMLAMYTMFFEFPHLGLRPVPLIFIAALAISVGFSILGALRGARTVIRLSPAEAMRAQPPATACATPIERYARLWRRLGFRWRTVARTIWRNRWRTAIGMFSSALGCALILMAFNFYGSIGEIINFQFDEVLKSDMDLTFKEHRDIGALYEIQRLPGVEHAEPLLFVACEIEHGHASRRSAITGVARGATLTEPRDTSGRPIAIPETGLVMSRRLANILHVRPGRSVTVTPVQGRREPFEVPITRITDSYLGMTTYADMAYLNHVIGEEDAMSSAQLVVRDGLEHRLALYRALKSMPMLLAISDNDETKQSIVKTLLEPTRGTIAVLIMLAGAIYFGSILTTSLVSIAERKREIATFRVMGFEARDIGSIFLRESLVVNMLGALLGLPLGAGFIVLIIKLYETEMYRLPLVWSPLSFVLALCIALAFALLAHGLVQRAINRLDWREALNARE
jgi:putative ABC transport system permease protein